MFTKLYCKSNRSSKSTDAMTVFGNCYGVGGDYHDDDDDVDDDDNDDDDDDDWWHSVQHVQVPNGIQFPMRHSQKRTNPDTNVSTHNPGRCVTPCIQLSI